MPVYKADEIHQILKDEKEHILDCLAGWVLTHFETKKERNDFLELMRVRRLGPKEIFKQQADEFVRDLRERIIKTWQARAKT